MVGKSVVDMYRVWVKSWLSSPGAQRTPNSSIGFNFNSDQSSGLDFNQIEIEQFSILIKLSQLLQNFFLLYIREKQSLKSPIKNWTTCSE